MKRLILGAAIVSAFAVSPVRAQEAGAEPGLEEIVVRGYRGSLLDSRALMRESKSLKDVVVADDVGRLPDSNIAEALNRVTSVYLLPDQGEGRYVSIRGVDPILNNVTMNGQTVAVSDTDGRAGRAAPLDVLSASSLSRIEVYKVTTPDMDGQSIGGTINIVTPSAFDFDGMTGHVNADFGHNDLSSDANIVSGGVDFASRLGAEGNWGIYLSANYWLREYMSQLYENPRADNPENDDFGNLLLPDRVRFGSAVGERERTNFTANLEYRPNDDGRAWLRYYYTDYTDTELRPEYTIRNRGDLYATSPTEFYWTRYAIENETRHEKQERPVHQFILGGENDLSSSWLLDANLTLTNAKETNPMLNYYETETRSDTYDPSSPTAADNQIPVSFTLNDRGFATPTFNPAMTDGLLPSDASFHQLSRFRDITSDVEEDTVALALNATWNGEWSGKEVTFKTGLKYVDRDKMVDDDDNRYPYEGSDTLASGNAGSTFAAVGMGESYQIVPGFLLPVPSPDEYRAHFNANQSDYEYDVSGSTSNSVEDDYTLNEKLLAGYLMATIDLMPNVGLTAGVRVEETDVDVSAFTFVDTVNYTLSPPGTLPFGESDILDISRSRSYTNVLPALVLRWEMNDNWLLRSSITSTIGRPDYVDTAPISVLEVNEDALIQGVFYANNEIGNPNLDPYEATNFDLSVDYYFPGNEGVISLGGFYKDVENAIYEFREQFSDYTFEGVTYAEYFSSTKNNAEDGHISGIELSYQQDLTMLPGVFSGLGFMANVAAIDSEVEVFERPDEKLPFFNQPDLLYNLQLYYEGEKLFARVATSYQSEAIFDELGGNVEDDIYRAERTLVDAKVSYQLTPTMELFFTGKNLTDEPDLTYRNGNEFFVAENPGYEIYGREYRVGFVWRLQ